MIKSDELERTKENDVFWKDE